MRTLLPKLHWHSLRGSVVLLLLLIVTGITLFPLFIAVKSSLQPPEEIEKYPPDFWPHHPTVGAYRRALGAREFGRNIANSVIVSSATTFFSILLGSLAAFSLSRFRFTGQQLFSRSVLLLYMFPPILLVVPLYLLLYRIHLIDTLLALIITTTPLCLPLSIWMLKSFFDTIPSELDDAAFIDGCSKIGVLFRIILPLSAPGVAATAVFAFIVAWGEYLFAITFINTEVNKTVVAGLNSLVGPFGMDHGLLMAASLFVALPPLVLFFTVQRYLIEGLTMGAVKG